MKIKLILLTKIALLPAFINSYTTKIDTYENENQKLIFCSDFHFNSTNPNPENCVDEIGIKQSKDVLKLIDNPNDSLLIVEDWTRYDEPNIYKNEIKKYWDKYNKSYNGFLPYINNLCKENGIQTINAEFRTFTNLTGILHKEKHSVLIPILKTESNNIFNEIENYNDCLILNKFYKQKVNAVKNKVKFILTYPFNNFLNKDFEKYSLTFLTLVNLGHISYQFTTAFKAIYNYKFFDCGKSILKLSIITILFSEIFKELIDLSYDKFSSYFDELLDARILHNIYNNKDKKAILICAGRAHIDNIINSKILGNLGFKLIKQSSQKNVYTDINKSQIYENILPIDVKTFINI